MNTSFGVALWPEFSEVWRFHWQAYLPLLPLLFGLAWIDRQSRKQDRGAAPATLETGLALALAAFFPLPFVVPFFAMSLVPLSYLALSGFRQGNPAWYQPQLTGLAGLMVVAAYSLMLVGVMRAVRKRSSGSRRSIVVKVALTLFLTVGSLLPIYSFNFESGYSENILCLFFNAHRWGQ